MIRRIPNSGYLRHALEQGFFDPLLQGHIHHASAVTTAAELQQHSAFRIDLKQGHSAAM